MRHLSLNEVEIVNGGNAALGVALTLVGLGVIAASADRRRYGYNSYSYSSYPSYSSYSSYPSYASSYQTTSPFCDRYGCGYVVDTYW